MNKIWILILIVIFSAIFRLYHLDYDLPYVFDPDEPYIMDSAVRVADGHLNHGIVLSGSLPYYTYGFAFKLATIFHPSLLNQQDSVEKAYKIDKSKFYTLGRFISAVYGIFEVILIFLIVSIVNTKRVALLSAFLLSFNYINIEYSHHVSPDTGLSFFILVTLFLIIYGYKKRNLNLLYIASFTSALAAAQKLPGLITLPLVILTLINLGINNKLNFFKIIKLILFNLLIIFLAYLILNSFIFNGFDRVKDQWIWENSRNLWWGELTLKDFGFMRRIGLYLFFIQTSIGFIIFNLSLLGLILNLFKKNILIDCLEFLLFYFLL